MNEKVKVFFINLIFWGGVLAIIAAIIYYQYTSRQTAGELIDKGVVTLGRVVFFKESGDNPARVRYAYYYKGQPYKAERNSYRNYEKGDYLYVMLLPEKPERGYHIANYKVNEADTVLNMIHDYVSLTEDQIRDLEPGEIQVLEYIRY